MKKWKLLSLWTYLYLSFLVLPFILSIIFYSSYPAQVAVHWDANGAADSFVSRNMAAFGLPAIMLVINLFFQINRKYMAASKPLFYQMGTWATVALSFLCQITIISMISDEQFKYGMLITFVAGILISFLGCCIPYLQRAKNSYKLNPEVEDKVSREIGLLWMLAGIMISCSCIIRNSFKVAYIIWNIINAFLVICGPRLLLLYHKKMYKAV